MKRPDLKTTKTSETSLLNVCLTFPQCMYNSKMWISLCIQKNVSYLQYFVMIGIGARSVYNALVTTVSTNSQGDWSTVIHKWKFQRQDLRMLAGRHRKGLISSWNMLSQATHASKREHSALTSDRMSNINVTMLRMRSKFFLKKNRQNYNLVRPRKSGWAIGSRLRVIPEDWLTT